MAKARGDLLHTLKQKIVGKAQLYGFLTDSSGSAVLDVGGNEQVSEVQVGENGRLKVDAVINGSLTKLAKQDYGQPLNVAAGNNTVITITPPLGEIWKIKVLALDVPTPVGATSGVHLFAIRYGVNYSRYTVLSSQGAFNKQISIGASGILTGDTVIPTTPESQILAKQDLVFTSDIPLIIYYENNTNALQNNTIIFRMVSEVTRSV